MEIYPNNEIKQDKTHRQKGASKMVNMGINIKDYVFFFLLFFKRHKNVQEIIMTHKNSAEEGERESSYNGKKLIFPVMLLEHCPVTMIGMMRSYLEGLLEDLCWENIISLE